LALGRLFARHGGKVEFGLLGHDQDLRERFAGAENVGLALRRRFEHQKEDHWPPSADERWDGDRGCVGRIGVEARMRLRPQGEAFIDLEVERQLIGVIEIAEGTERRPLAAMPFRRRSEIALKRELARASGHPELSFMGVDELDSVTRAFRERDAVPGLLHRPVFPRLSLATPAGDFEPCAPRIKARVERAILDLHREPPSLRMRCGLTRGRRGSFPSRRYSASSRLTVSVSFGTSTA